MKNIDNFIKESKTDIIPKWEDLFDWTGSSDNTLEKGRIVIGLFKEKYNPEIWDNKYNEEYELFVKAYKAAGGKIEEETANQGSGEVFCNYEGHNEATKYILLSFCRLVFGKYVKK